MPANFQQRLPIAAKAALLIAALGLTSIFANWFCLQRIDEIKQLNEVLTRHIAPARLALAEAKAALESFGTSTYKSYFAADREQAQEAAAAIENDNAAAKNALHNAVTNYPDAAADVERIVTKLKLAHTIAINLRRPTPADVPGGAQGIIRFDAARDDVAGHLNGSSIYSAPPRAAPKRKRRSGANGFTGPPRACSRAERSSHSSPRCS